MNVECEWASEMEDVPRPLSKVTILVIVAVGIATVILAIIGYRIMDKCEPEKDEARKVVDLSLIEPDYAPDPRIPIIDLYLADYGSPASGTGALWVQAEADTGVSASLMLAVFGQESTFGTNGSFSQTHFNGWGLHDPQRTNGDLVYRWTSWQESIPAAFRIVANTWGEAKCADDLRGYCGGDDYPPADMALKALVRASERLKRERKGNPLPMNKECDYIASELYDVMTSLQGQ